MNINFNPPLISFHKSFAYLHILHHCHITPASAPWCVDASIVLEVVALALVHMVHRGPRRPTVVHCFELKKQTRTRKPSKRILRNVLTVLTMLKILNCSNMFKIVQVMFHRFKIVGNIGPETFSLNLRGCLDSLKLKQEIWMKSEKSALSL